MATLTAIPSDLAPKYEHGEFTRYALPHVDEGWGDDPVFVYLTASGHWLVPLGTIRAASWEEAYEVATDALMHDADPDEPETYARDYDETAEEGQLAEGVHYRPNGSPGLPGFRESYLARSGWDDRLERLTPALAESFHIRPILPGSENFGSAE